ncbi:cupredoxin domain-containing protein [Candidatus Pacearchaeota archaeon]|nr:cupredoxin domain-containing protein [Candidatus Pacearchaeota archaeon]
MKKQNNLFFLIGGLLVVILIFFFVFLNPNKINSVSSDQFEQLISSEEVYVINAHTPYIGEIEGTDLNAYNWENMDSYLDQLPEDKSTPIAIYCRSGRMSTISAHQLLELGYTNIYDLDGGMNTWQSSGRNLVQNVEETGEIKEFDIVANNWDFSPNKIEVNLGDQVILNIESVEGAHGIALYDFEINEFINQGDQITIEFIANKQGTFSFYCNVPCGHGHSSMNGLFIVN